MSFRRRQPRRDTGGGLLALVYLGIFILAVVGFAVGVPIFEAWMMGQ